MPSCALCRKETPCPSLKSSGGSKYYCPTCLTAVMQAKQRVIAGMNDAPLACSCCRNPVKKEDLGFVHVEPYLLSPCCAAAVARNGLLQKIGATSGRTWFNLARLGLRIFTKL